MLFVSLGVRVMMAKLDIQHIFRLITVRPDEWHLLGKACEGQYYFDLVLPFGARSSPFLFCQFSEALRWIVFTVAHLS